MTLKRLDTLHINTPDSTCSDSSTS